MSRDVSEDEEGQSGSNHNDSGPVSLYDESENSDEGNDNADNTVVFINDSGDSDASYTSAEA